jgi:pimeloyl-ACP methyl ester carboxylesterase
VLGGFVPDSTEQVFLLRGFLLRQGSVYYLNYPRRGFSLDLLCAQLDDLVEELAGRCGRPPVVLSVSFGGGVVLEWLRRRREEGKPPELAGLLFVSPVACVEDLIAREGPKPATLMGRAIQPYLNSKDGADSALVEKSRGIMSRMFEAGAQNHAALQTLMSGDELRELRAGVLAAIQGIDLAGARERVSALQQLAPLPWPERIQPTPLSEAPTLILYAEKETSVIAPRSPTRMALEGRHRDYFSQSRCMLVTGGKSPVQHASLIFHYFQFLPFIAKFYRELRPGSLRLAA